MIRPPVTPAVQWRNADVDWDDWPVQTYLAQNYRHLHACDDAVIAHHSAYYRRLRPASIERSLELGAGPNLYPLLLAAGASTLVHAVEPSTANVAYLVEQVERGADIAWQPFYDRCRELNPALPPDITGALRRVWVERGDAASVQNGRYDLASMHFVAESISEDREEVGAFCRAFLRSVRPGGHLVASFREGQSRYGLGDGSQWPGCPVDTRDVSEFFGPYVDDLVLERVDADPVLPDYYGGSTGTIVLTARRTA